MQTDLITKVYFNEHLTHSCVGMPQGLQALLSSLITESLFMIAPAIHIHNRKHISHSTSPIKTYLVTPRQSIGPQRHHAIPTAPLPAGQSETRGVYGYHVRTRRPTCPYGNLTDRCHSVQVQSDLGGKYNTQRLHDLLTGHLLQIHRSMYMIHLYTCASHRHL